MSTRYAVNKTLNRLRCECAALEAINPERVSQVPRDEWNARVKLLQAQVQVLTEQLSPGSLFKSMTPEEVAAWGSSLHSVGPTLEALENWNNAREDAEASQGLTEDVERILARRFLKNPIVLASTAILLAAASLAVLGFVRFQNTEFNFAERITQKGNTTLDEIEHRGSVALSQVTQQSNSAVASVTTLQAKVSGLESQITAQKDRVADLTSAAVKDLSLRQVDRINGAATEALHAVDTAKNNALGDISAHAKASTLDEAVKDAKTAIGVEARDRITRVSQQIEPEFRDALERAITDDKQRLGVIQARLGKSENRGKLLDAALRVAGVPDKGLPRVAAAAFGTTLYVTYTVAAITLLLLVANAALLYANIRGRS